MWRFVKRFVFAKPNSRDWWIAWTFGVLLSAAFIATLMIVYVLTSQLRT